jgi:GEVED domain-containing protein/thrombospondin type 3 repeat protein
MSFTKCSYRGRATSSLFATLLAALAFAGVASAQQGVLRTDVSPTLRQDMATPGLDFLGGLVAGPFDVENKPAPPNVFMVGVEYAFGNYWVTGGDGSTTINAGQIYKFDLNGNLLGQFPQNSLVTSTFCHRDGEANESANLLYFGEESNRIVEYAYNPVGGTLTNTRVLTLVNPGAGGLPSTCRALARHPLTGNYFTANFGSSVFEFTIPPTGTTATVVKVYPNPTLPTTAFFGMAWNRTNNTLWGFSQNGTPAVRADEFSVGASTLTPTGVTFQGANLPISGPIAGGCDIYNDPRNPGFLSMVSMHQSTPDSLLVYDTGTPYVPAPYHDACGDAAYFPCGSPPATVSTVFANVDAVPACGPAPVAPGVWFKLTGTGEPVTLSTCDAATNFDTRITVFSGPCGSLVCVADNDDTACGANPLASTVTWSTVCGVEYRALVHGGKLSTNVGTFRLTQTCRNYCLAGTSSACGAGLEYISRVRFGAIDNSTPSCSPGGYALFCSSTPVSIGCPQAATVDISNPFAPDKVRVWFDWNQDNDFTDPGEEYALTGAPPSVPVFTGNITPPIGALLGVTRMRVGLDDSASVLPCGITTFSDFEDYTVIVNPFVDTDGDGTPDCIDGCPSDPLKIAPGVCGCGIPDTDTDGDGTPDCIDGCPSDPLKIQPGLCGCGVPDTDTDGDGTPDCFDGCPTDPNKIAPGFCGCGRPETDTDGDGTPNCIDDCPHDPNKIAPGVCGCGVPDVDSDGDGVPDCIDGCPSDPNKVTPGFCGCNVPETDTDGDGTPDCIDGCPLDPNKTNPGACGCGIPDTDGDGDGFPDCIDNCPNIPNANQLDTDADGVGDVCDNCPLHFNPNQHDCDHNGVGDTCEIANGTQPDCNLNGLPDNCENDCNGNNVADDCDIANQTSQDLNGNGIPDECEGPGIPFCFGDGNGTPCPCGNNSVGGKGCKNSGGKGGQLYNSGSTSVSLDDSRVTAIQLPPLKVVVFYMGQLKLNGGNGFPFYDGLSCVKALKRFPAQFSDLTGLADVVNPVALSGGMITPGSTWHFQAWYRDQVGGPCGFQANTTNALQMNFTP